MPGENVQDWSIIAADNANADTLINWQEGQPRASVNNSARSMMAAHAKNRNLQNGSIVTGGTPNAQTFTSGVSYTTVPTCLRVLLKIGAGLTNTGATTLQMDGIAAAAIKNLTGNDLTGGELIAGGYFEFLYDGTNWLFLRARLRVNVQVFPNNGIYTPIPGMVFSIIECVGGGGGGGGAVGGGAGTLTSFNGGGGGSGGYSRSIASAATIGASQSVTVGSAGAGGLPGIGNGGGGGTSSIVGAVCTANGGGGGLSGYFDQLGQGGPGGVAGIGNIVAQPGSPGGSGFFSSTPGINIQLESGNGGASFFGGGGKGLQNGGGAGGGAFGAGGSGGGAFNIDQAPGSVGGGPGASGIVIITEYGM